MTAGRRDEGADLGHQRDQRVLTHIRRFACHIRAGDDEAAVGGAVELRIVGHEEAPLQHLLYHRVAALGDGQLVAVVHHGAAVVVLCRHLRQRRQHIQLGHGVGRPLDAVELTADLFQQLSKEPVLQCDKALVCAEDLVFQLLQLLRDVALAGGEGLFADVGLGDHLLIGVADLDEVTEDVVVADLQLGDARLLPQARLQLGEDAFGIITDGAQLIHLRVVALGDDAAVLQGGGGIRVDGCEDGCFDVVQQIDLARKGGQLRAAAALGLRPQVRQALAGLGHRVDLLGRGRTIDRTGHEALEVGDIVELLDEVAPLHSLVHEALYRAEAAVDGSAGHQRLLDPAAQHPLAHGRAGLVQHPEQRPPLFAAPQRLGQLKVGPCDRRQAHELSLVVGDDRLEPLDALDLGIVEIFQQRRHRKADETVLGHAGLGRPVAAKLVLEGDGDEARGIPFLLHQLDGAVHVLFEVGGDLPAVQQTRVHQHLAGVVAAKLCDDRRGDLFPLQLGNVGRAGGDVSKAEARRAALQEDAGDVVVLVILKHTALDDGARRDHPDDVPLDEALGLGRVFHLLADGDLIALCDEAGHIALVAVKGHAAHGRTFLEAALLARKGQVQLPRGRERIVEEHLVEIADAIEKDLILMLFFYLKILLHHGRKLCHDRSPSSPCCRVGVGLASKTVFCKQNAALHCTAAFCKPWMGMPLVAAAAGRAAAGAGSGRLLHGHGVAAVHGGVDDGVDIVHEVLAVALGLVVGHHALVGHDLAVEVVHLLVQLGDACIAALGLADLVVQVHPGQIELADEVLQLLVLIVHLAGLIHGQIAGVGLKCHRGTLEEVDAIHCNSLLFSCVLYSIRVYLKSRKFSLFLQAQLDFALNSLEIHKGFLRLFALNPACACEIFVIFFVFRYTLG